MGEQINHASVSGKNRQILEIVGTKFKDERSLKSGAHKFKMAAAATKRTDKWRDAKRMI
jgi:hypothetical protein